MSLLSVVIVADELLLDGLLSQEQPARVTSAKAATQEKIKVTGRRNVCFIIKGEVT
jgi:hypothetical protein